MKLIKTIFITVILLGLIWVDLPENIKTKYELPNKIDVNIFGLNIKKEFNIKLLPPFRSKPNLVLNSFLIFNPKILKSILLGSLYLALIL